MGGWMILSGNIATSWLHLASWNLPDSQLSWESKMESSVAKTWMRKINAHSKCRIYMKNRNLCPGIFQTPISKLRTPFWHYQDNPLTPSIHCQDTIDSQLSTFNKENLYGRWSGGWFLQEILPLHGSILQVGTCQILSWAENPRIRVWQ